MPRILLSLAPEAEPRERLLTIAEAQALFAAAIEPHQFMYLMVAFALAARPAAILELTTFQIDYGAADSAQPSGPGAEQEGSANTADL